MKFKGFLMALALLAAQSQVQAQESVLNIADAQGDWGLLAPFVHSARGQGYIYNSFVFDSLLWKNTAGQLQPLLASAWAYQPVNQCYTFEINQQASWHDGRPVTVDDVVFSFAYMQQHAYRFVDFEPIKSVQAQGSEVEVCLKRPHASFLANIAATLPIIPEHIYSTVEDPLRFNHLSAAVGSGPYRLLEYNKTQGHYRLQRHAEYHLGVPKYAQVRIMHMNPYAALAAMQRQQVDFVSVPYGQVERYRKAQIPLLEQVSNHPVRLLFNHTERFAQPVMRQGLARLIDRQQLLDIVYRQGAQLARVGYRQELERPQADSYLFDPEYAEQQLIQAGLQKKRKGIWLDEKAQPVRLSLLSSPRFELLARAVAQQLEQQGFAVDLRLEQDVQLTERLRNKNFDLALLTISHEGDPDRFRLMISGQQQRSDAYEGNQRLLRLLQEQVQTLDVQQREALLDRAEVLYNQDLPSYPLINPINFVAYRAQKLSPQFTQGGLAIGIPLALNKLELFFDE